MAHSNNKGRNAFTILELAVVLVIIGLLVGGVVVGRSMLRQSQVMSITTDEQKYVSSVKKFIEKYGAQPGDFNSATTIWGAAGGTIGTNYTTDCIQYGSATSPATCNGDGDGQVAIVYASYNESLRVWQHLANAGFIDGAYTGTSATVTRYEHKAGVTAPASRVDGGMFGYSYTGLVPNNAAGFAFKGSYQHSMFFGSYKANSLPVNGVITGKEALAIDAKFDDGKAPTGNISTWQNGAWGGVTCATTTDDTTAQYNLTSSELICSLIFKSGL